MNRLRSPTGRPVVLRAVRSNAGLRARYQTRLNALIDEMQADVAAQVEAAWREKPPELAQDDAAGKSSARNLRDLLDRLSSKWKSRFDQAAESLGRWFGQSSFDRSDDQLRQILKDGGFTVGFKLSAAANDALQATIGEQIGLIKSIASEHLSEVQGLVMRSVSAGRDLGMVAKGLEQRLGVTKQRAALIARDQNNRATATITRVRQQELGITTAAWLHSAGGKHPRPSHVAASGKTYDVATGMKIDGEFIYPGQAINCRCVSRAIIPGFE